jgi:putative ABC transport system permease protein
VFWLPDAFRIPLCFLRSNYGRVALTIGALAAGVALVCAIQLVNESVLRAFEDVIDTMAGRAALQISAGNAGFFPEEVADTVTKVPGVELAAQTVGATAFVADTSGELLTIHGVDITNDAAVRVYQVRDAQGVRLKDPLVFLNQPDSVILTNEFARRRNLRVGDGIELEAPAGRQHFTIRGLLEPEGIARVHGGDLAIMDLYAAEAAFTHPGLINRIDVVVKRDADVGRVREQIAGLLPPGLTVEPPEQRKADLQKVMLSMQVVLFAVSLLALGAAFLIAFNRLATVFDERAWQHGVMRAVGARRTAVRWELLKEGLVLGTVGVALGLPLGIGLARVLLPFIATTTALNSKLLPPNAELLLGGRSVALAVTLGLVTSLLAAARPASRAASVPIAETLRGRGTGAGETSSRRAWVTRATILVGTLGAMIAQLVTAVPAWGLAATVGILVAVALLARPFLDFVSVPVTRLASRHAASGFFAAVALTRKRSRTALTVATLGVGFGTVIWIWVVAQSFERSVVGIVHGVLRGDLAVASANSSNGFVPDPISDSTLDELKEVPGIASVVGEQVTDWHYANGPIAINAFDSEYVTSGRFGDWPFVGRSLPDLSTGFAAGRIAIISTSFALHLGASVGDTIVLDTPSGPLDLLVGGIVSTLLSPRGTVMIAREVYKERWNDPHIIHALVRISGTDVASVRSGIAAALGKKHNLTILTLSELGDWFAAQVRQAFAGLYLLAGLILFVVLFGAADTLAAGVLEQQRELAVVRATGVRAQYLQRIVLIESLLLAGLGLTMAMVVGLTLGIFWVETMLPSLLGWVLELHIPYVHLVVIAAMSLLVSAWAAIVPGRWARRVAPAAALRYE